MKGKAVCIDSGTERKENENDLACIQRIIRYIFWYAGSVPKEPAARLSE